MRQENETVTPRAWLKVLRSVIGWAAMAGTALLLVTVLADVTLRFIFNQPVAGGNEYVAYWCMPAIVFGGLSMAERQGEHIDAPLVFDRLPAEIRREFTFITRVVVLVALLALAWWGFQEALAQAEVAERGGASGVTIWPARFFVPLGALSCAVEVLIGLIPVVGGKSGSAEPEPDSVPPQP